MNAEIINIGDELLIGQVVNTNASYMSKVLNDAGINVKYVSVINDDPTEIKKSVLSALHRADCVLITGGLGPTKDDMTKYCLNEMFGGKLIENEQVSKHVEKFFTARNLPYTSTNRSQAMVPDCCQVVFNPVGTAPGMIFFSDDCPEWKEKAGQMSENKLVVSMPGVPFEMQRMTQAVIPILLKHYKSETIIHKSVLLSGIGESFLSDQLEPFERHIGELNDNNPKEKFSLAYLPDANMIRLRLSLHGGNGEKAQNDFETLYCKLKDEVRNYIVGEDDKNIAQVVGEELKANHQTLATAESCTGGNIAHVITLNAGASSYFKGSVVSYCNEIKNKILGVQQTTLDTFGAVSEQTAKQMAENVLRLYETDFAISVTGLAGPDSDGSNNEVGTVYVGIACKNGQSVVEKTCFKTSRTNFIDRVTNFALFNLLKYIRKQ